MSRHDQLWNPHRYFVDQRPGAVNDGEEIWYKLISRHDNVRFVLCGHALDDGTGRLFSRRPDGTTGRVLGVHMVGPWVTEQLGAGYFAVNWEATAEEAAALIQPHPSLSETFGETLLALAGRGLHVG